MMVWTKGFIAPALAMSAYSFLKRPSTHALYVTHVRRKYEPIAHGTAAAIISAVSSQPSCVPSIVSRAP